MESEDGKLVLAISEDDAKGLWIERDSQPPVGYRIANDEDVDRELDRLIETAVSMLAAERAPWN